MNETVRLIWTIGYGNQSISDFINMLDQHRIDVIVDIRQFPSIAKQSHFKRDTLRQALRNCGVQYHWVRQLGKMRKVHEDSRNVALSGELRGFADHMTSRQFEKVINQLLELSENRNLAIASEVVNFENCHRKLLSDYLYLVKGCKVVHLHGSNVVEHMLTTTARYEFGHIIYDYAPAIQRMLH